MSILGSVLLMEWCCRLANKIDLLPDGKLPDGFHAKFEELLKGRRFAFFETNITAAREPSSGLREAFAWLGDAIASSSKAETTPGNEKTPGTSGVQKKPVEKMLAGMRSPAALSSKLEDWLSRAENDPVDADELLRQFYALDLPSWDHYIHLRLAYVLLLKFGRREGMFSLCLHHLWCYADRWFQARTKSLTDSRSTSTRAARSTARHSTRP